jgi:hypothetical protein
MTLKHFSYYLAAIACETVRPTHIPAIELAIYVATCTAIGFKIRDFLAVDGIPESLEQLDARVNACIKNWKR